MSINSKEAKDFKNLIAQVAKQGKKIRDDVVNRLGDNIKRNTPNVLTIYDMLKACKDKINLSIDAPRSQYEATHYCVKQIEEQQSVFLKTLNSSDKKKVKSDDARLISPIAKLTVTYYHRVMALNLMYGYNITTGQDTGIFLYKLVKPEAERFWVQSTAGLNEFFITLTDFMVQFKKTFPNSKYDGNSLYKSVSLCFYDGYISKYEFDFLTIICGQFHNIPSVIDLILTQPFFFPSFSFIQAQDLATSPEAKRPGTFYFRYSLSTMKLVCCFITDTGICFQQQIGRSIPKYLDEAFKSGKIKVPYGMEKQMDLEPLFKSFQAEIVDSGDGKYVAIGPENKQRVICQLCTMAKVKVRIEPCIHLICNACHKLAKKFKPDYCGICGEKYTSITHIQMKYVEDPESINYERVNDDNDVYGFIDSAQDALNGQSVADQDVHPPDVENRVLNRLAIVFNCGKQFDDKFDQMGQIGFTTLQKPTGQSGNVDDLYEDNLEAIQNFNTDYSQLPNFPQTNVQNPGSSGLLPNKGTEEEIYNQALHSAQINEDIYNQPAAMNAAPVPSESIYNPLKNNDNAYGIRPGHNPDEDIYNPVGAANNEDIYNPVGAANNEDIYNPVGAANNEDIYNPVGAADDNAYGVLPGQNPDEDIYDAVGAAGNEAIYSVAGDVDSPNIYGAIPTPMNMTEVYNVLPQTGEICQNEAIYDVATGGGVIVKGNTGFVQEPIYNEAQPAGANGGEVYGVVGEDQVVKQEPIYNEAQPAGANGGDVYGAIGDFDPANTYMPIAAQSIHNDSQYETVDGIFGNDPAANNGQDVVKPKVTIRKNKKAIQKQ